MSSKLLIALALLASAPAMADQTSDKARLDACFDARRALFDEVNIYGADDEELNAKIMLNGQRCLKLQRPYEKAYGKYIMPKMATR